MGVVMLDKETAIIMGAGFGITWLLLFIIYHAIKLIMGV